MNYLSVTLYSILHIIRFIIQREWYYNEVNWTCQKTKKLIVFVSLQIGDQDDSLDKTAAALFQNVESVIAEYKVGNKLIALVLQLWWEILMT